MIKDIKPLAFSLTCLLSASAFANEENIPGVKALDVGDNNTYVATCANDTSGVISFEENNICVFSQDNQKNRCDTSDNWTVEKAAEYICDGE